jgi:hypothetical protein
MKSNGMFSSDGAKALIADTIRLYVGLGRRLSFRDLAEALDMKEGTLRSYVADDGPLMPLDLFMRLFTILPPEAFAKVAREMGFQAAPAETADDATVRHAISKASKLVALGAEILEDNVITPKERADFADEAANCLPVLQMVANTRH